VTSILDDAASALRIAGCDSPDLDAELLLAHVLGWDRARILARPDHSVGLEEREAFAVYLDRRRDREPLAHILGHREFYGLDFIVDRRVLVPRPETELLVELAIEWARPIRRPLILTDVGTGSGCVAVSLATHLPHVTIHALDASADALVVARANVARHALQDRVLLWQSDFLEQLPQQVDAIVANLPYVRSAELGALQPEVRDYEPRTALDGGPDGLAPIRRLLTQAVHHLRPGGAIFLEIGAGQGRATSQLARQCFPGSRVDVLPDYSGHDRVLSLQT
jgi:release factor glutamine methyltransferase